MRARSSRSSVAHAAAIARGRAATCAQPRTASAAGRRRVEQELELGSVGDQQRVAAALGVRGAQARPHRQAELVDGDRVGRVRHLQPGIERDQPEEPVLAAQPAHLLVEAAELEERAARERQVAAQEAGEGEAGAVGHQLEVVVPPERGRLLREARVARPRGAVADHRPRSILMPLTMAGDEVGRRHQVVVEEQQ
jgi:hypothetical protein